MQHAWAHHEGMHPRGLCACTIGLKCGFFLNKWPSHNGAQIDELPDDHTLSDILVGRTILYMWDGLGWLKGKIVELNRDNEVFDGDDVANFWVYYESDGEEAAHFLCATDYWPAGDSDSCAPAGAWCLICE